MQRGNTAPVVRNAYTQTSLAPAVCNHPPKVRGWHLELMLPVAEALVKGLQLGVRVHSCSLSLLLLHLPNKGQVIIKQASLAGELLLHASKAGSAVVSCCTLRQQQPRFTTLIGNRRGVLLHSQTTAAMSGCTPRQQQSCLVAITANRSNVWLQSQAKAPMTCCTPRQQQPCLAALTSNSRDGLMHSQATAAMSCSITSNSSCVLLRSQASAAHASMIASQECRAKAIPD